MSDIFVVLTLIALVVIQAIDRIFLMEKQQQKEDKLLDELSKANKALISKSAQDYVMMQAMDKTVKDEKPITPGDQDSSELSDDEFDKMITRQNA